MKCNFLPVIVLSFVFTLSCFPVFAAAPDSRYTAEVVVNSHSEKDRKQGFQAALQQVLIKITGSETINKTKTVQAALPQIETHVSEYGYYQTAAMNETGQAASHLGLRVQFDPVMVKRLVNGSAQPVWSGQQRPTTLLWLTLDTPNGAEMIGAGSENAIPAFLKQAASQRDIPVVLPLLDLEEMNNVSPTEINNHNLPLIQTASARYGADVLLIGQVKWVDKKWQGQWLATMGAKKIKWDTQGETPSIVLGKAIDNLADGLASRYATHTPQKMGEELQSLNLTVADINSLTDFDGVKQYLSHLPGVKKLQATNVQTSYVVFQLMVEGGAKAFQQALLDDPRLTLAEKTKIAGAVGLTYKWVG